MKQQVDYVSQTIDVYDVIADSYAKQALKHGPGVQRRHFCSLVKKGGKILDVGCGSGRDCAYFVTKGFKTVGVDLSDNLLEIAKKAVPRATFIKQDIRALTVVPNSFDGIWSCTSLLHVKHEEIPATLHVWFSILKPGGILFIHVKKGEGEVERVDPSVPGIKRLFSLFLKEQVEMYCKQAGFTVLSCYEVEGKDYETGKSPTKISCFAKKI